MTDAVVVKWTLKGGSVTEVHRAAHAYGEALGAEHPDAVCIDVEFGPFEVVEALYAEAGPVRPARLECTVTFTVRS